MTKNIRENLKTLISWSVEAHLTVPRTVFINEQYHEFQEALKEVEKDPRAIVTITERPSKLERIDGVLTETNYYNDIVIERKQ